PGTRSRRVTSSPPSTPGRTRAWPSERGIRIKRMVDSTSMRSERGKPVVDFDHHSEEFSRDWPEQLAEIRKSCPVAWSEAHGGYWVLTKADDVHKAGISTQV